MTLERLCGQATIGAIKHRRGEPIWGDCPTARAVPELVKKGLLHQNGSVYAFTHAGMKVVCAVKETSARQVELTTAPEVDRRYRGELDPPGQDQIPESHFDVGPSNDAAGLVPQLYANPVQRPRFPIR